MVLKWAISDACSDLRTRKTRSLKCYESKSMPSEVDMEDAWGTKALSWGEFPRYQKEPQFRLIYKMKCLIYLVFLLQNLSCSPLTKYSQSNIQFEDEVSILEGFDIEEKAGENDVLFIGSSSIRLWDNIQRDMYPYNAITVSYTHLTLPTKRIV